MIAEKKNWRVLGKKISKDRALVKKPSFPVQTLGFTTLQRQICCVPQLVFPRRPLVSLFIVSLPFLKAFLNFEECFLHFERCKI
jgi:hypothetical protein